MVPAEDVGRRVQHILELDGTVLTEVELARLSERYAACGGTEPWDVRAYARATHLDTREYRALGAREYRVVRGNRIQHVFASDLLASAAAVRMALNQLESGGS